MSAAASAASAARAGLKPAFLDSTIGKKVVMAATGVILFGFVIVHMLGNLQVYLGPDKLDIYGHKLRELPALLWAARAVLLISVVAHVVTAIQLSLLKNNARPVSYAKKKSVGSTYASRTMMWSGPILAAFIIYHILHFTTGTVHPTFQEGAVHRNLVIGFQQPIVSVFYIGAMVLLCLHLYHGAWSMFQTLGVNHPKYTPILKRFAAVMAIVIAAGNISIPVSVLAGVIK